MQDDPNKVDEIDFPELKDVAKVVKPRVHVTDSACISCEG